MSLNDHVKKFFTPVEAFAAEFGGIWIMFMTAARLDVQEALEDQRDLQANGVHRRQVFVGRHRDRRLYGDGPGPPDLLRVQEIQLGGPCGDDGGPEHDEGAGSRVDGADGDGKGRLCYCGRAGHHAGHGADRRADGHGIESGEISCGAPGGRRRS